MYSLWNFMFVLCQTINNSKNSFINISTTRIVYIFFIQKKNSTYSLFHIKLEHKWIFNMVNHIYSSFIFRNSILLIKTSQLIMTLSCDVFILLVEFNCVIHIYNVLFFIKYTTLISFSIKFTYSKYR